MARHYLTGLLMTSLNPLTLAFWFSAATIKLRGSQTLMPLCSGVAAGAMSWVIFFSSLMALAGRASKRATLFLADVVGGVTLLGFALHMIWRVLHASV